MMNDVIKVVLSACCIFGLLAANNIIFEKLSMLDMDYLYNVGWSVLFSITMTALEVSAVRIVMGKLKVRLIWE